MQLVQGAMQVDFYPAAGLTDKFVQVTSFDGAEMSERLINKREMQRQADERINQYGYKVTKFNTSPRIKMMVCC
jgi:hypothetical protein